MLTSDTADTKTTSQNHTKILTALYTTKTVLMYLCTGVQLLGTARQCHTNFSTADFLIFSAYTEVTGTYRDGAGNATVEKSSP